MFICTKYHWPNTRNKRFETRFNKTVDHHCTLLFKSLNFGICRTEGQNTWRTFQPRPFVNGNARTRPGANICTFARGVDQRGSRFGARVTRGGKRRIGHKAARRSTVTRSNRAWNRLNTRDCRLSTPLSIVSSRVHPLATCHLPRGCFRGLLVAEWKLTTFFFFYSFLSLSLSWRWWTITVREFFKNFDWFSRRSIVHISY